MNIFCFKNLISNLSVDKEISLSLPIGETEFKLYNSLVWFLTNKLIPILFIHNMLYNASPFHMLYAEKNNKFLQLSILNLIFFYFSIQKYIFINKNSPSCSLKLITCLSHVTKEMKLKFPDKLCCLILLFL